MPSKSAPFTPSSILFRPRRSSRILELRWRRRVLPPGPIGLLRRPFIAIAGLRRQPEYKAQWLTKKEAHRGISGRIRGGQGRPVRRNGPAWAARPPAAAGPENLLAAGRAVRVAVAGCREGVVGNRGRPGPSAARTPRHGLHI